ncbi:MAG TPA: 50S ribosomal protein L25 [Acidimicrobiia bacterium]|jgi:large subunit ribosomal protein L25|nr:50S ribosomal protein L25 [Acidimicrobiia bacterium]
MPDITLATEPRRELGSRPAGRLRREGKVPAVVYGLGADTVSVTVPSRELQHILAGESGANTLITLDVDGESVLTLARQIHRHPTRGELVHVDFIRIRRDVAVSAEIPVHLLGEATGVRDGGLLEQLLFQLTVEAMPGNIPVSIEIDVSDLAIGDQLRVEDIPLPAGVETQAEPDFVVAQVAAPRVVTEAEEGEEGEAAEGEAAEGGEAPAADASDDAGDE